MVHLTLGCPRAKPELEGVGKRKQREGGDGQGVAGRERRRVRRMAGGWIAIFLRVL